MLAHLLNCFVRTEPTVALANGKFIYLSAFISASFTQNSQERILQEANTDEQLDLSPTGNIRKKTFHKRKKIF